MKEAYGGIMNLFFISIFLVIVSGILGYIVCYAKAFKMKNNVISVIENYEGSGCMTTESACYNKISEGAQRISYAPISNLSCPGQSDASVANGAINENIWYKVGDNNGYYFCIKRETAKDSTDTHKKKYVYTVATQVDIKIPVVTNIMGFSIFRVTGSTHEIELP